MTHRYMSVLAFALLSLCCTAQTETDDSVVTGRFILPAKISMPEAPRAGVVLVHGSGPNDMDETLLENKPFKDLADGLARQGIAVLRYDKRTKVYKADITEDGHEMTIDDEVTDDAVSAVRLLKKRLCGKPVYVAGHSLGAMLAPRIAQRCPEVGGIVMMASPARSMMAVATDQIDYLMPPGTPQATKDMALAQIKAAAPESYWASLDAYDQVSTALSLDIPILILQGERDYQVTLGDYTLWKLRLRGEKVTSKSYPALNHLFMEGEGKSTPNEYMTKGHVAQYVIDDIAAFIR